VRLNYICSAIPEEARWDKEDYAMMAFKLMFVEAIIYGKANFGGDVRVHSYEEEKKEEE